MKPFEIQTAGITVTNENFKYCAEFISKKYGVCPALNNIVMALAANDETAEHSRKGLNKAINNAIEMIGYKPSYFNKCMREIGLEH